LTFALQLLLDIANTAWYIINMVKRKLSVGDLVKVSDNTHDMLLPDNRTGLIVEQAEARGAWVIYFSNGNSLMFHEMFLEKITNDTD